MAVVETSANGAASIANLHFHVNRWPLWVNPYGKHYGPAPIGYVEANLLVFNTFIELVSNQVPSASVRKIETRHARNFDSVRGPFMRSANTSTRWPSAIGNELPKSLWVHFYIQADGHMTHMMPTASSFVKHASYEPLRTWNDGAAAL